MLSGAPQRDRTGLLRPDVLPVVLVLVATAVLIAVLKLTVAGFGSIDQLTAILVTAIFLVVASFGQGLVILTGGIDLSIGAVMGVGGMIVANLTRGVDGALLYALPIALLSCTGIGVINGLGVAIGRLAAVHHDLVVRDRVLRRGLGHDSGQFAAERRAGAATFHGGRPVRYSAADLFYSPVRCGRGLVPEPQRSRAPASTRLAATRGLPTFSACQSRR